MADPATVMRATGIEAGYGRVQVLWGAGLNVKPKESVVLLGPTAPARQRC